MSGSVVVQGFASDDQKDRCPLTILAMGAGQRQQVAAKCSGRELAANLIVAKLLDHCPLQVTTPRGHPS